MPLIKPQVIHSPHRQGPSASAGALPRLAAPGALHPMNPAERATADEWFERYLDGVFRYVLQRVHGIEEARDITAEVFVAAAEGLPRFRGECPPFLWLLSIARKQIALARRRRESRRETLASELPAEGPGAEAAWEALAEVQGPETALIQSEARRVVRDLLAQLSPDQREAVLLQYVERLSVAEIATVMGRSPASVTGLLQRARATLRKRGGRYFLGEDEGKER
jgi:RNA polymerase sigma-70 factor, ECF subfamily